MHTRFFILLLLLLPGCGRKVYMFTSFHEPATGGLRLLYSFDARNWTDLGTGFLKPLVDDRIMRDPSLAQGPDGTYHLVWTSSWKGNRGFGYASSKDLIHWSEQRLIDVMKEEPTAVNIWAPELFYDKEEGRFIIIWASTIPHRFPRGMEDENNNHRMYYTTTKDFRSFTETRLFLDPGFSIIDCVIVQRGRDYVLVLKDNTRPNRNIKVAFAKKVLGPYTRPSEPFTPNFTEGPAVAKAGRDYLIYYDQYQDKIYGAMRTKDFQTFTNISNQVRVPGGHKHGTIFKIRRNTWKKLVRYQRVK